MSRAWTPLVLGATVGLLAAIPGILNSLNSRSDTWPSALVCLGLAFVLSYPAVGSRRPRRSRGRRLVTPDQHLSRSQRGFLLGLTAMLALEAVAFFLVWVAFVLLSLVQ